MLAQRLLRSLGPSPLRMARKVGWRELRPGIAALLVITALVVFILVFGRVGRIRGDTYHAFVRADEARGIITGSEVWLNGQKVGAVRGIEFLPPSIARERRVLLDVELMERHKDAIRHDSDVQIRSGGSLIGAPVVYLMVGTAGSPVVAEGDTIHATAQIDLDSIGSRYAAVADEIPAIMSDAKAALALMRSEDGTVGAMLADADATPIGQVGARVGAIASSVRGRRGTIGLALGGDRALVARAQEAMARADSIRQLLASRNTSFGRFRRDSTLASTVADIRNELSIVVALLQEPRGTAGRMVRDSAVVAALADVEREMAALFADLKQRPFRYLSF